MRNKTEQLSKRVRQASIFGMCGTKHRVVERFESHVMEGVRSGE